MYAFGDSSRWSRDIASVYEVVFSGVLEVWPTCRLAIAPESEANQALKGRRRGRSNRSRLEDPITRNLIRHLRLLPGLRGRFIIDSQHELIDNNLENDPDPIGYADMAVKFFLDEDAVCLIIECKRLNVRGASRAGQYVTDGMMRFVNGQYALELPMGGMIGYVMDGRLDQAAASVVGQIEQRSAELRCEAPPTFISEPDSFATTHSRGIGSIELWHQLLAATDYPSV